MVLFNIREGVPVNFGRRPVKVCFQSARGLAQSKTWRTYPCFITREASLAFSSHPFGALAKPQNPFEV